MKSSGNLHLGKVDQIADGLKTEASPQERLERLTLTVQRVDRRLAGFRQRRLEHVRQQPEDRVQRFELGRTLFAVRDSSHQLCEEAQVDDQRSREERVLALMMKKKKKRKRL